MEKINESVIFIFKVHITKYTLHVCIVILCLNACFVGKNTQSVNVYMSVTGREFLRFIF